MAQAFWVGGDGNVWLSGNNGSASNMGKFIRTNPDRTGFDSATTSMEGVRMIADPNAPVKQLGNGTPAPNNPNGGGGSNAPVKPDKSNDIALNQAGLGSVDQQTAAGLSAVDKALGGVLGSYDSEYSANHDNYGKQSDTNQNNRQTGIQSAYLNAVQGRQGLFGTMARLGMLNGDGITLGNRAVQQGANEDLSGVDGNFKTNQTQLDTAINTFDRQNDERKKQATTAAEDARTNINNNGANNKLKFYSQLASDYADMGDTNNAKKYTGLASAQYPTLASTSIPSTNIAYQQAAFTPGTLGNYIAGQNGSTVSTSTRPDAFGIPSLLASPDRKKATT